MNDGLTQAARALTGVLERENAALEAMDIPAAIGLLDAKRAAAEALSAFDGATADGDREAREAVAEMRGAAQANRRLLERAMSVQARVIAIVGRAVQRGASTGYGADGLRAAARTGPVSLSARA